MHAPRPQAPVVSVIINAYNGGAYLQQTLRSVLAQTWHDWEVVLWDDQSTDDTAAIFRSHDDPRFRYFRSAHRTSLSDARRAAVKEARGTWLAFLDQDDIWSPRKLELQMAIVSGPGVDRVGLVYGRAMHIEARFRQTVHDHRHEFSRLPEGDIFVDLFRDSCFLAMSTVVVRKSAYDEVGGFSARYRFAIDYQLYIALARVFEARAVQEPCCAYRVHTSSMSSQYAAEVHEEVLRILDEWAPYLDPRLYRYRHRVHSALLALEEIRAGDRRAGIMRLLNDGSWSYLCSRPFARTWRAVRRRLRSSPWSRPVHLP